jgi:hypothetical protein
VGFDVLTTCQPSTVWCSRERLPAAAAQPAKVRQNCSATEEEEEERKGGIPGDTAERL